MRRILCLLALIVGLLGFAAPQASAQDTNDFYFKSFEADYYLDKDTENRSTVKVVEKLVAVFPSHDQNHGIERAIPKSYDGHDVSLAVQGITNGTNDVWEYSIYDSNDNLVLRIGDADRYVHGTQTYVITYTLRDVTKAFDSHDELFWDTNGTEWRQRFDVVTARFHIPSSLASSLTTPEPVCYTGSLGSKQTNCTILVEETLEKGKVISATNLSTLDAYENMSVALAFKPHTFSAYVAPPLNPIFFVIGAIAVIWYLIVPIIVIVRAVKYWRTYGRDPRGKGTIVPEYAPPKDTSLAVASVVLKDRMPTNAVSAQLIDFAVRGYIKLYEKEKKTYELELVKSLSDLTSEEQAIAHLWFGPGTAVRARAELDTTSHTLYSRIPPIAKQASEKALQQNLMQDVTKQEKKLSTWGWILLVLSFFTLNPFALVAAIVMLVLAYHMPARTHTGVELRDYLFGLKLYMQTAEADRIKQLQAPDTAEKIDVNDSAQLVKLYEQLLPYAMLFGIESQWVKQFAHLYTQPPEWFAGNWSAYSAAALTHSLADLSTNTTSSFSAPSSSSSSGFSGGSSGGGGGGGGGGGW